MTVTLFSMPRLALGFTFLIINCGLCSAAIPDTVVRDVTVLSPELGQALVHVDVVLDGGRIVSIAPSAKSIEAVLSIDGKGKFLVPGLIDSHVHLYHASGLKRRYTRNYESLLRAYRRQMPRSYLYYGFTSLIETNAHAETNRAFEATPEHPELYHCSTALVLSNDFMATEYEGADFFEQFPNFLHDRYTTASLPTQFDPAEHTPAATVAKIAATGARCVKMYYEEALWWPGKRPDFRLPSLAIVREVVAQAHLHKMSVILHATTPNGHRFARDAGVDVVAHGMWEWPGVGMAEKAVPKAIRDAGRAVAASGLLVQPTVQVIRNEASSFAPGFLDQPALAKVLPSSYLAYLRGEGQAQRAVFEARIATVIATLDPQASKAGLGFGQLQPTLEARYLALLGDMDAHDARWSFGTDTAVGAPGWGNPPGLNGYWEMQNWQRAGISLARIFHAATLGNAQAFGLAGELGSVSVGKRANLLLLTKNPLETIEAYDSIQWVFLQGRPLTRESLSALQEAP